MDRPVISVGNLAVGGTGKTPTAAHVARLLVQMGHRPAILSRGYARQHAEDGVVVVSDGNRLLADVGRAGDEPLMLARAVREAVVLVGPDRHLAGRLAERRFGCTVHVLDDGFQHLALERTADLVLVREEDVERGRVLPAGRLRESLEAVRHADAVVLTDGDAEKARSVASRLGAPRVFWTTRRLAEVARVDTFAQSVAVSPPAPVLAVAGIVRPQRFFDDLGRCGFELVNTMSFRDHYQFRERDLKAIVSAAQSAGAELVVTTEKDAMRLLPFRPFLVPLAWARLEVTIEPAAEFLEWVEGVVGC